MKFFSQQGEDSIVWSVLKNVKKGFFLDIGALDGKRFSNTYTFELQGWNGICVEAHPKYYEICKNNRPKSVVIHAAVSKEDRHEAPFYVNERFYDLRTSL